MTNAVYIGLGTNLGDREKNLSQAVELIVEKLAVSTVLQSTVIETPPWGFESKDAFLNQCIYIETQTSPTEALKILNSIEKQMGRTQKSAGFYSSRIIDLDLLFYNDTIYRDENLILPHPLLQERLFVLEPLAEIAPELIHPIYRKTISALLDDCRKNKNEKSKL